MEKHQKERVQSVPKNMIQDSHMISQVLYISINFMINMDAGLHGKMQWNTVQMK